MNESQPFKPMKSFKTLDEIYYENYQGSMIESPLKLSKNSRGLGNSLFSRSLRNDFTLLKDTMNKMDFYSQNSAIRLDRIKIVLFLQIMMVVDIFIEGNDKFPSLVGIKRYYNVL